MARLKESNRTRGGLRKDSLDYHEGLSANQVKIILRELELDNRKFDKWMYGQTCPVVKRYNGRGEVVDVGGIFEYDLFRWISSQKTGIEPIWD